MALAALQQQAKPGPGGDASARARKPPATAMGPLAALAARRLMMQAIGNQGMLRRLQKKSIVSQPHDPDEIAADRVADAVVGSDTAASQGVDGHVSGGIPRTIYRKCDCGACADCTNEDNRTLQRKATGAAKASAGATLPAVVTEVLQSAGEPLAASARNYFEPRFGGDFAGVRIHTDRRAAESARAVNALAYTVGRDVVFGAGRYAPYAAEGRRLLAHELAHVVQQQRLSAWDGGTGHDATAAAARAPFVKAAPEAASSGPVLQRQPAGPEEEPPQPGTGAYIAFLGISMVKSDQATHWGPGGEGKRRQTILEYIRYAGAHPRLKSLYDEAVAAYPDIAAPGASPAPLPAPIPTAVREYAAAEQRRQTAASKPGAPKVPEKAPYEAPFFGLSAAPDAFHGIVPYYNVKSLPFPDWTDTTIILRRRPYLLIPNLRKNPDGTSSILYWNAYRNEPGLIGPTGWNEYAIGPDSIQKFLDNIRIYAGATALAYSFGPPTSYSVDSARSVDAALSGQFGEAANAYGRALSEAAQDPGWWVQLLGGIAGLAEAPEASLARGTGAAEPLALQSSQEWLAENARSGLTNPSAIDVGPPSEPLTLQSSQEWLSENTAPGTSPGGAESGISIRQVRADPRWNRPLSIGEQRNFVQYSPQVNPRLAWRSPYRFVPPEGGGVVRFGPRAYTFDPTGNLVRGETTELTLGVRDPALYRGVTPQGTDFGHLLGPDFGHIDAELGRYGGFPQNPAVNRPLGASAPPPLWYQAERVTVADAASLSQAGTPFRVVTEARGFTGGVPAETRIYLESNGVIVRDSGWIANPRP
jgi:Domain of unknown function (DUF4157)